MRKRLGGPVDYEPVESDRAAPAAAIAPLLEERKGGAAGRAQQPSFAGS
jgi:hypothetical protein